MVTTELLDRGVHRPTPAPSEWIVAGTALIGLILVQILLSNAIHGSNYYGVDGRMAQAIILGTLNFGSPFDISNISALQGMGSQLLPKNAWANPAYWPFAFLSRELATDVSALVALAIFAIAVYILARCFDVPVVPSAISAQLSIALFAPAVLLVNTPTNFCLTPGDAVVYAPYMIALGLLNRLEPGSWRNFGLITAVIVALVFMSIYLDPLWAMVAGFCWAIPFIVVSLGTLRWKTTLLRCASLVCCLSVLIVSGTAGYLHSLSQYTARVQFSEVLDRVRVPGLVSALTYSPNMKYFYFYCAIGWVLGLITLRGRAKLLVLTGISAFSAYFIYGVVYLLLLNAVWIPPIPIYLEQCLFALFMTAAIAGVSGALVVVWRPAVTFLKKSAALHRSPALRRIDCTVIFAVIAVAVIPLSVAKYVRTDAKKLADVFYQPWGNQSELAEFLESNIGLGPGQSFRGSVNFLTVDDESGLALTELWTRNIPTPNEYSQLVTPQSLYFVHKLLKRDVRAHLNQFNLFWSHGQYTETYWKALQMLGVRYSLERWPLPDKNNPGLPLTLKPYRPVATGNKSGFWYLYELPQPNIGNYSPVEVVLAQTGDEIMAKIADQGFDFMKQAVLSSPIDAGLQSARDMRFSISRGILHVSGKSDGTSLVVLPQQFSNCLRPKDERARLVRTNLMMTGIIFSGELDTDILFDYSLFSSSCRRLDLADIKRLDLKINLPMKHLVGDQLFPDWAEAKNKLRAAMNAVM